MKFIKESFFEELLPDMQSTVKSLASNYLFNTKTASIQGETSTCHMICMYKGKSSRHQRHQENHKQPTKLTLTTSHTGIYMTIGKEATYTASCQ